MLGLVPAILVVAPLHRRPTDTSSHFTLAGANEGSLTPITGVYLLTCNELKLVLCFRMRDRRRDTPRRQPTSVRISSWLSVG